MSEVSATHGNKEQNKTKREEGKCATYIQKLL